MTTLREALDALPMPKTDYVLAREARPYESERIYDWPGYEDSDICAARHEGARLALERAAEMCQLLLPADQFIPGDWQHFHERGRVDGVSQVLAGLRAQLKELDQ